MRLNRTHLCRLALALTCSACGTAGFQARDPAYQARPVLTKSLIRSSEAVLSEDAIQALLTTRIQLPDDAKAAVFSLGSEESADPHWNWRADEMLQNHRALLDSIENSLLASERFTEVTHLPSLLVPAEPSLVRLREAAALMQADLLVTYRTQSQMIYDFNLFSKDEVKAHAVIELMLVDVRTGVIAYADTQESFHIEKQRSSDADRFDTTKRATLIATQRAVEEVAVGLGEFVTELPN